MRSVIFISFFICSSAFADPSFLSTFEGHYSVSSRKCGSSDSVCASTASVDLIKKADGTYLLRENNDSGVLSERTLSEVNAGAVFSTIQGDANGSSESGWWMFSHKNSSGKFDHNETISFSHDFTEDNSPVSFSDVANDMSFNGDGSVTTKTFRRMYVLKK